MAFTVVVEQLTTGKGDPQPWLSPPIMSLCWPGPLGSCFKIIIITIMMKLYTLRGSLALSKGHEGRDSHKRQELTLLLPSNISMHD